MKEATLWEACEPVHSLAEQHLQLVPVPAHARHLIRSLPAAIRRKEVGPLAHEQLGDLLVATGSGGVQRRGAIIRRSMNVRPLIDESGEQLEMASPSRPVQWGGPSGMSRSGPAPGIGIRLPCQDSRRKLQCALFRCDVERGQPSCLLGIGVASGLQAGLYDEDLVLRGCLVEQCEPFPVLAVGIRLLLEELLHNIAVALLQGEVKRGHPSSKFGGKIGIGQFLQEHCCELLVAQIHGDEEGRQPRLAVYQIGIGAELDQCPQVLDASLLRRLDESKAAHTVEELQRNFRIEGLCTDLAKALHDLILVAGLLGFTLREAADLDLALPGLHVKRSCKMIAETPLGDDGLLNLHQTPGPPEILQIRVYCHDDPACVLHDHAYAVEKVHGRVVIHPENGDPVGLIELPIA
mmetsp:Transcript_92952/g.206790  ORF Transcript_92952/g.206790 Transcript_92952/m.206790 type:complete len:407 (+) Transcript_92952:44-1264(+)